MDTKTQLQQIKSWTIDLGATSTNITTPKEGLVLAEHELRTEYGNAQRFIYQHGAKVKYCHSKGQWYIWTGKVWQADTCGQVEVLAMNTARSISTEAGTISDLKKQTELMKWAQSSLSHAKVVKTLKIAQTLVPVAIEQFDADSWKINVRNGIVDLKSGELLPHDKDSMMTNMCNASYLEDVPCPTWDAFLYKIFDGKEDLIRYVQKMLGYSLTGSVSEKCFFILHGEKGDNGKSVLINVLMEIFAQYGLQTPVDTLLRRQSGAASNDLARLDKARFVSGAETNKQCYFDEAMVKRLTGDDPVTARFLRKEFDTFKPVCKIFIATNRVPRFDREDTAFNNRVKIIPFDVSIPAEEQDRNLKEKLMAEADGIFSWAVRGCLLWQQEGLGTVPSVTPPVEIRPSSSVEHFVATCCVKGDSLQTKTSDLYAKYLEYHFVMNGETEALALTTFGGKLGDLGFIWTHERDGNVRVGIALRVDIPDAEDCNLLTEDVAQ